MIKKFIYLLVAGVIGGGIFSQDISEDIRLKALRVIELPSNKQSYHQNDSFVLQLKEGLNILNSHWSGNKINYKVDSLRSVGDLESLYISLNAKKNQLIAMLKEDQLLVNDKDFDFKRGMVELLLHAKLSIKAIEGIKDFQAPHLYPLKLTDFQKKEISFFIKPEGKFNHKTFTDLAQPRSREMRSVLSLMATFFKECFEIAENKTELRTFNDLNEFLNKWYILLPCEQVFSVSGNRPKDLEDTLKTYNDGVKSAKSTLDKLRHYCDNNR